MTLPLSFSKQMFLTLVFTFGFFLAQGTLASAENLYCGKIFSDNGTEVFDDCDAPFGEVDLEPSPFQFLINGEVVTADSTTIISPEGTAAYDVTSDNRVFESNHIIYLHDGDNYRQVSAIPFAPPTEQDARELAESYFDIGFDFEIYIQEFLGNPYDNTEIDYNKSFYFNNYVYDNYVPKKPMLLPGTYTVLSEEFLIFSQVKNDQKTWWSKLYNLFIPTAYAQYYIPNPIWTITFTLTAEEIEPEGASSILFLPGIMGSRLYEDNSACGSKVEEQERWVSRSDCDQLRLQTNYLGQSLHSIYTYANESALVDEIDVFGPGPNIYKTFLSDLKKWKEEESINDYLVLPYDWRLRIDDLMKLSRDSGTNKVILDSDVPLNQSYLYETISRLAQNSDSGKVTVVTHSNGGLVIKYFLKILEENNDPLLDRIDNVILVAVPQEGTPESIIGILHGVELGAAGIVMGSEVSRKLLKDAPFGFHLLPTEQYFDSVITPLIQFEEGMSTNAWRTQFGENLSSYNALRNFMVAESGRADATFSDTLTPAIINSYAFTYKSQLAEKLANWEAPEGVKIYQVAGTGLSTPSGITYFTDIACVEESLFQCVRYERKLGYRINTVIDGDATVVTPSALSMAETETVERWWIDLEDYNITDFDRIHRDILEVEDIRKFILAVAASSSDRTYSYLNTNSPTLGTGDRLIMQLHSPLDMFVILSDGAVVGSSTELVRNIHYRRFGEVQHLSIPASERNYTVYLNGQSDGSFSLDVEKHTGNVMNERLTYSAVPSTASTKVVFPVARIEVLNSSTSLAVDYDGDGIVDVEVSIWSGEDILPVLLPVATTTPIVNEKRSSGSSGTRIFFPSVPPAPLVAGVTDISAPTQLELMQRLIILLEQYRDLLISISSDEV